MAEEGGEERLERVVELVDGRSVVVLSGAGCSTESGVPDYRGPQGRLRVRRPVLYQEFLRDPAARVRYWARSAVGWPRFRRARPNEAHRALARLERCGVVRGVITQNVDGLHTAAGSRRVLELHGRLARVRCLECARPEPRASVQERIRELNPGLPSEPARLAPDGDAEIPEAVLEAFRVPTCSACGGDLKPDVVFFGENVPRTRVERAWSLLDEADLLLVVGSSLEVYSGRRFVSRAVEEAVPVVILNQGPTRCDADAALKLDGRAGRLLPALAAALQSRWGPGTFTVGSSDGETASGSGISSPGLT